MRRRPLLLCLSIKMKSLVRRKSREIITNLNNADNHAEKADRRCKNFNNKNFYEKRRVCGVSERSA